MAEGGNGKAVRGVTALHGEGAETGISVQRNQTLLEAREKSQAQQALCSFSTANSLCRVTSSFDSWKALPELQRIERSCIRQEEENMPNKLTPTALQESRHSSSLQLGSSALEWSRSAQGFVGLSTRLALHPNNPCYQKCLRWREHRKNQLDDLACKE